MDLSTNLTLENFVGATYSLDESLPSQGYSIQISNPSGVHISYRDEPGRFYAGSTLSQLLNLFPNGHLPIGSIIDWPDIPIRSVMLDVSRTRVPRVESLLALIDVLASWKINQLQIYFEHTFKYSGHESVWQESDPYDCDDIDRINSYCKERFIELVPSQNMLGHMERWLLHPPYDELGIIKGVGTSAIGMATPASTLDPRNPQAIHLVEDLANQLCEVIPGDKFHVGLDEPWDLPKDRSQDWITWLDQLSKISSLKDRRLLVWGDMLENNPDLVTGIGRDITVTQWNYEGNYDFTPGVEKLASHQIPTWLCPGTSSWLSIAGRLQNAIDNSRNAARVARDHNLEAVMITDWGDFGHLQHLSISLPGFACGASFAWCLESNSQINSDSLGHILDTHYFGQCRAKLGSVICELGQLYSLVPVQLPNLSVLVMHLYLPQFPVGSGLTYSLNMEHLEAISANLDKAASRLSQYDLAKLETEHTESFRSSQNEIEKFSISDRIVTSYRELVNTSHLMQLALEDAKARISAGNTLESLSPETRALLYDKCQQTLSEYQTSWMLRNREGGLQESCAWLIHLMDCYKSGNASFEWAGPLVELARAKK